MILIDHVAQALRIHDGQHDKGAAELAEIALRATSEFFEARADQVPTPSARAFNLLVADRTRPPTTS